MLVVSICQDDPSFPFRLVANLRPPEFMEMAFIGMYGGSEVIVVRGETREALEQFVKMILSAHIPGFAVLKLRNRSGLTPRAADAEQHRAANANR